MGFDSKRDFIPSTVLLGLLLCVELPPGLLDPIRREPPRNPKFFLRWFSMGPLLLKVLSRNSLWSPSLYWARPTWYLSASMGRLLIILLMKAFTNGKDLIPRWSELSTRNTTSAYSGPGPIKIR